MPATVAKGCPTCGLVSFTFSATDSSSLYVNDGQEITEIMCDAGWSAVLLLYGLE